MVQRLMDGPSSPSTCSCDRDGLCLNAIPRTMLESRGGESIKGPAIADPELIDLGRARRRGAAAARARRRCRCSATPSSGCASRTSTPASAARSPARCTPRCPGRTYPELIVRMAAGERDRAARRRVPRRPDVHALLLADRARRGAAADRARHRPGRPAPAALRISTAGAATLAAVLRPMLAGMLSVLLVAGVIGLGVYLATDEPSAAPERPRRPPRRRRHRRGRHADADERRGPPAGEDQDAPRRRQGRRVHGPEPARPGRRARGARVHRGRLQLQPADVGDPLPDLVRGRRVRAGHHAGARPARPRARARADRDPVQAGHARRRPSAGSRSSSTSSTAATTSCCSRTRPRCRTRSPRPRGATCSAARR